MNNQAPINPNMPAFRYFSHMYANYLRSTVGAQHNIGASDYRNYVLPVIRKDMNPFLDDSKFITSRIKMESRMQSLYQMINGIIAKLREIPNSNIIKRSIFNPLIQKWYTAIHDGGTLLSTENHIIIKCVFEIWSTLILYVDGEVNVRRSLNGNVLLDKFNTYVLTDYSNNSNTSNNQ
jgi:hypothetical protein